MDQAKFVDRGTEQQMARPKTMYITLYHQSLDPECRDGRKILYQYVTFQNKWNSVV